MIMIKEVSSFVKTWEERCYKDGIPDNIPPEIFHRVPSYRMIAMAILKNDVSIIGVERKPCEAYIKLKRHEISKRPGFKPSTQLSLF